MPCRHGQVSSSLPPSYCLVRCCGLRSVRGVNPPSDGSVDCWRTWEYDHSTYNSNNNNNTLPESPLLWPTIRRPPSSPTHSIASSGQRPLQIMFWGLDYRRSAAQTGHHAFKEGSCSYRFSFLQTCSVLPSNLKTVAVCGWSTLPGQHAGRYPTVASRTPIRPYRQQLDTARVLDTHGATSGLLFNSFGNARRRSDAMCQLPADGWSTPSQRQQQQQVEVKK